MSALTGAIDPFEGDQAATGCCGHWKASGNESRTSGGDVDEIKNASVAIALIFCHGAVMVREIGREFARSISSGDEIKKRRWRRVKNCVDRSLAGQRDRRRRQAIPRVRVEGMIRVEIPPLETAERCLAAYKKLRA